MTVKDDPRSSVKAADAAEVMERLKKYAHGSRAVVIINVTDDGSVDCATYGEDAGACKIIGDWAADFMEHSISVAPFQTYFGWGHDGVPTAMDAKEYASLTANQRAYVGANSHPSLANPDAAILSNMDVEFGAFVDELKSTMWLTILHLHKKFETSDDIPTNGLLHDDLDIDSLDGIELTMAVEDLFDITLEDDALLGLKTVHDVAAMLWRKRP